MTGTIDVVFGQKRRDMGDVGILGENICNVIRCDVTSVAEEGTTFVCACQRPDDPSVYTIPVTVSEEDDKTYATVELTSYELYRVGILNIEFRAIKTIGEATRVIKWNGYCDVLYGLFGESDEPGMPIRDALDRLDESIDAASSAASAANTAATSASSAATSASNAASSANTAATSANTAATSANTAASSANAAAQRAETAAQTAVQGVMVDGTELERDAQKRVDIPLVTRYTTGLLRASDYARIMAVVDNPPVTDISSMSRIVQSLPLADLKTMFKVGDQIIAPWRDLDDNAHSMDYNAYITAWNIAHVGMVDRYDGLTVPGVYLQMHKCSAYGVQYSHQQAFYQAFNATLPAGTYNVTFGVKYNDTFTAGTTGQFTLAQTLPVGGRLLFNSNKVEAWASATAASATESVNLTIGTSGTSLGSITSNTARSADNLNAMQKITYGHGRWLPSAARQYLNSDKTNYFSSTEDFDLRPNEYAKHGFMAGFNDDFLNAIKPVRVTTALNTVEGYTETTEDTFDTFFLPSLEQMNVQPQLVGVEGETFDYWKQALGSESFVGTGSSNVFDAFKIPAINNDSAQHVRLRSANRDGANNTWSAHSSGYVGYYSYAASAYRFSPVCVIC